MTMLHKSELTLRCPRFQPSIAFYKSLGALSMGEEWDTMRLEGEPLQALEKLLPANVDN